MPPSLRALLLASLALADPRPVLAIVPGEHEAEDLVDDLALFIERPLLLPAWGTLPFEHVSPNVSTMAARAEARHRLVLPAGDAGEATVVVAPVRAAVQRVSPSRVAPVTLDVGDEVDFDGVVDDLVAAGYTRTDRVEGRGEVATRGGIIDLFPAQGDTPHRVEFWGDEVTDIRTFSPGNQRSRESVGTVTAYPARELMPDAAVVDTAHRLLAAEPWAAATWDRVAAGVTFPGLESWLPWLAPERSVIDEAETARLVVFDPAQSVARAAELRGEEEDLAAALAGTWGESAPPAGEHPLLYLPLDAALATRPHLAAPPSPTRPGEDAYPVRGLDAVPGDPASVGAALSRWKQRGVDVVIAMDGDAAAERVARLLGEAGFPIPKLDTLATVQPAVLPVGIHRGFVADWLEIGVVGEQEIAGRRRSHRRYGRRRGADVGEAYRDLRPGDHVVHHHHGIGQVRGAGPPGDRRGRA